MIGAKLFQYGNAVYLNNTIPEFGKREQYWNLRK